MRVVALGRKKFLFVGHEQAGQNLANLYSLVATCMANGKDPLAVPSFVRRVLASDSRELENVAGAPGSGGRLESDRQLARLYPRKRVHRWSMKKMASSNSE